MLSINFPVAPWGKLIKKDFIIKNNLFFKAGIIHEDDHWCYFLAKHTKHIAFLNQNTLIHYITPNSVMRTRQQNNKSYKSMCIIWEDMINNIDTFLQDTQIKRILHSTVTWYIYDNSSIVRKEMKHVIGKLKGKIPNNLRIPFFLYYYLPYLIRRRPFMARYFYNKFSNKVNL